MSGRPDGKSLLFCRGVVYEATVKREGTVDVQT